MPSTTFLNLPKEKQDSLINAAIEEFSNETYLNASINSIIKSCNIPRGSFYMYFTDKEELYLYIISLYKQKFENTIDTYISNSNGDMIEIFKILFEKCIKECTTGKNAKFFTNIIINARHFMGHKELWVKKEEKTEMQKKLFDKVDISKLNIIDEKSLENMLNILITLSIHKLIEYIKCSDKKNDDIIKNYIGQLELLRKGFYKGN